MTAESVAAVGHGSRSEMYRRLWGKSRGMEAPYPLVAHLLDTAAAAEAVVEMVIPRNLADVLAESMGVSYQEWRQTAVVLAGWHDIGKASCGFQQQDPVACPSWLANARDATDAGRHDRIGACLAWDRLAGHRSRHRLAQIIGGHHGTIPKLSRRDLDCHGGAGLVDVDPPKELLLARQQTWCVLDSLLGSPPDAAMPTVPASATLAVVVLADWIASCAWLLRLRQQALASGMSDPEAMFSHSRRLAAALIDRSGLVAPTQTTKPTPATMFATSSATTAWTPLQQSIADSFRPSCSGIAVICAPTGEGKTEAALLAASRLAEASGRHGIFFAMPTVATAEGLHDRLGGYIKRHHQAAPNLKRVHSQAILWDEAPVHSAVSDDADAVRAAARWMTGTRKAILAPCGIGTIDQVLLGALRAKHSPLRLLGAATGTLIVDEAHSLDPYMRQLLERCVEWLASLGTPVVVMSATMPHRRVCELVAAYQRGAVGRAGLSPDPPPATLGYPMWGSWTLADGWKSETTKPRRSWMLRVDIADVPSAQLAQRIAAAAVAATATGKCVLVVRSTVAAAQRTYDAALASDPTLEPGETLEILHSRMPQHQRRRRSQRLIDTLGPDTARRPSRLLLVATQVVEQSLDVDFDLLITDPAPVSALLQRAGRVQRHRPTTTEPVQARVLWPVTDDNRPHKGSRIYSKADLMAARAWLTSAEASDSVTVAVPSGVPAVVDRADAETSEQFDFATPDEADEAEDATLAQLVRIDSDKSLGLRWAIPRPDPETPLADLTGHFDTDERHPGTRHKAQSVLIVPVAGASNGRAQLHDGTGIELAPAHTLGRDIVRAVFDAAIPVSYPNSAWADALAHLTGRWDRTPVCGALLLNVPPDGSVAVGGHRLTLSRHTGLAIRKQP